VRRGLCGGLWAPAAAWHVLLVRRDGLCAAKSGLLHPVYM
jgi:hypothetical protein